MKKYFIAILFAVNLLSIQNASAATLSLSLLGGIGSVTTASGTDVSGNGRLGTFWEVTLSGLAANEVADLDLDTRISGPITFFSAGFLGTDGLGVRNGTYTLGIFLTPLTSSYTFNVALENIQAIPVPAAVWLFGSALFGMMGFVRRKSPATLAA